MEGYDRGYERGHVSGHERGHIRGYVRGHSRGYGIKKEGDGREEKCNFSQAMKNANRQTIRGVPSKRPRTEEELQEAADRFSQDWTPQDQVMPWIRAHEPELSAMVSAGWSWDDVGRAMARARITYKTEVPMKGSILRAKAYKARKDRSEATTVRAVPARTPVVSGGVKPAPAASSIRPSADPSPAWLEQAPEREEGEPEFKPISLRTPLPPTAEPKAVKTQTAPERPKRSRADALAMLTNRPVKTEES